MTNIREIYSSADVTGNGTSGQYTLFYDPRPAGSGKTHAELEHIVENPGLYLFACERRESIREHRRLAERLRAEHGSQVHIVEVMSADDGRDVSRASSVRVQIEALPNTYGSGHVLAFCTHNGLMDSALDSFEGWELVVDETPSVFESRRVANRLTWQFLDDHFAIIQGADLNSIILATASKVATVDFKRDTMAEPLAVLHRRASAGQYHVLTDLDKWGTLADEPNWRWTSIWSPNQLRCFRRVVFLSNAFDRSLTGHVFSSVDPNLSWRACSRPSTRVFANRRVTIAYFASAHRASRGLFDKAEGKRRLTQIAEWVSKQVDPANHIWSSNERDKALLVKLPGSRLSPRQAGTNSFSHIDAATMLYAAKADPDERDILEKLGIDPATVTETREFETIYQFITRTSVRDPASVRPVLVYVYDYAQAAYLAEMLGGAGYVDVVLNPLDLGFLTAVYDAAAGRPKKVLTEQELSKKADQKRLSNKERKRKSRARKQVGS